MEFSFYSGKLFKSLVTRGFEPLKTEGFTGVTGLINTAHSAWYSFFIINADDISFEKFKELNFVYNEKLNKIKSSYGLSGVIAIYLLVSLGDCNEDYREFLLTDNFDYSRPVVNVYWHMDLEKMEFTAAKNCPDKIQKLEELVKEAAHTNTDVPEAYEYELDFKDGKNYKANLSDMYIKGKAERLKLKVKAHTSYMSYALMILNLLIFCVAQLNGGMGGLNRLIDFGAIAPGPVFNGQVYRLFTAMFIHANFTHIISNMLGLYIFGIRAEKYLGSAKFLTVYIISGLASSIFSLMFTRGVSVGASGALLGAIGGLFVITIKSKASVDGLNVTFMIIYIAWSIIFGGIFPDVDNFGHIGGLIMGIALGWLIYRPEAVSLNE